VEAVPHNLGRRALLVMRGGYLEPIQARRLACGLLSRFPTQRNVLSLTASVDISRLAKQ
jgi:hypothetical protein